MEKRYQVVYRGEFVEGSNPAAVKTRLVSLFKSTPDRIERLLSKKPALIARGLTHDEAEAYVTQLREAGLIVSAEESPGSTPAPAAPPPRARPEQSPRAATPPPPVRLPPGMPERARDILFAFTGPVEPVRTPAGYMAGLIIVAFVMVLLPGLYVLLIGLAAYGTAVHAMENVPPLTAGRGLLFLYLIPIVSGVTMVLFMVKPLFFRSSYEPDTVRLERKKEPLLFAFIEKVARLVHAPSPSSVEVDMQVNASASFRRGLKSLFANDLALTIGLPLAAGLTQAQFAGVLAHEFGHFSQGVAMRLTYLIGSVNRWFARVVYERDFLDEKLIYWSESSDWSWVRILLGIARFFVWLTRRILSGFMYFGIAVSSYMLRQMEFDADRHEARLVGANTFDQTSLRLVMLQAAFGSLATEFEKSQDTQALPQDLPAEVFARFSRMPESEMNKFRRDRLLGATKVFDSHPADRDRIQAVRQENARGVFHRSESARDLFSDFAELSVRLTAQTYQRMLAARPTEPPPPSEQEGLDQSIGDEPPSDFV